jgi:patatin-like phospholipase/acyl hydrolase
MANYYILSLDGGGIRGILSAILLERLEGAHPGMLQSFDLFCGTSTGGILALAFAYGLTPAQVYSFYKENGKKVFADSVIDNILDLGNFTGAQYSNKPLKDELTHVFGDKILGDLPKKVLVASFDLDNEAHNNYTMRAWKPKFFHNYPGKDSDSKEKITDVALRTSAAPTYFPIYQGYIDGGVVADNPSICGLAQALNPSTGGQKIENLILLSIGTGLNPHYLIAKNRDWGLLQWAPHMVDIMLEGSSGTAEYQCQQILDKRFFRINPVLPVPIALDDVEKIPLIEEIANQVNLIQAITWVNHYFPRRL